MPETTVDDEIWRKLLTEGDKFMHSGRLLYSLVPSDPRCSVCNAPFGGVGGRVLSDVFHIGPSHHNPSMCNVCDRKWQEHPGGAEVKVALMFADVRGSTGIAESMSPLAFRELMDRFFKVGTEAVVQTHGIIEKFIGDQIAVMYVPGFSGSSYVDRAIQAGIKILEFTGHGSPEGPWIPVGVGVHWGAAYVGMVGVKGAAQLTVLGDTANIAARLASSAGAGEVLLSDAAYDQAGLALGHLEQRVLELKGKSEPFGVRVWHASAGT